MLALLCCLEPRALLSRTARPIFVRKSRWASPDRVTPPTAAAFSMMMLATTPAGDAYTFAELESISENAGFARVELAPPEIGLDRLVIAYR